MWERLHNMLRLFDLRGLKFSFVIPVSIDCRGPETSLAQNFFSCATYCATMECFQWWSQTSCACLKNIVSTGRYHRDLQNPDLLRCLELPPKMGAWGPRSCHKWCDYLLKVFIVTSLYAYICPGTHKRAPNLCNDTFTTIQTMMIPWCTANAHCIKDLWFVSSQRQGSVILSSPILHRSP